MSQESTHILYVEDDEGLSFVTKDNLEVHGYTVTHIADGQKALKDALRKAYDLIILDVMLPGIDGFSIAREIRKQDADVPIIFLTAKSLKDDRIQGLTLGGDDYITKPFSIDELILKIEVFLRRKKLFKPRETAEEYHIGAYKLDFKNLILQFDNEKTSITQREAELIRHFVENKNQVLKRGEILKSIWGENDYFLGRSLDVFVSRLRKLLVKDPNITIENIHGVGFRMNINETEA